MRKGIDLTFEEDSISLEAVGEVTGEDAVQATLVMIRAVADANGDTPAQAAQRFADFLAEQESKDGI